MLKDYEDLSPKWIKRVKKWIKKNGNKKARKQVGWNKISDNQLFCGDFNSTIKVRKERFV